LTRPSRLLAAADYAASAGLDVWLGPELGKSAIARCRSSGSTGSTSTLSASITTRQQAVSTDHYLAKISQLQATGKPVAITEFGFASCRDADDPKFLGPFNAAPLSMLGMAIPILRPFVRPRVRTVYPRDEQAQARLLIDQLRLLDRAGVDRAFVMNFSFPLAPYCQDPNHDLDAATLSIVRALPRGQHGTTYPDVGWEPKEAFHPVARYYRQHEAG
jgi:hypothetical protein